MVDFGPYGKSPAASVRTVNSVAGNYYLLQDLLYRTVALVNSNGSIVEAYDTESYGNTLIFTALVVRLRQELKSRCGEGTLLREWGDAAVQSDYGANEIIYCGYRYDAETEDYYVRNRYYSPVLGRWITRDPIGYAGGINLYEYAGSHAAVALDASGEITINPVFVDLKDIYGNAVKASGKLKLTRVNLSQRKCVSPPPDFATFEFKRKVRISWLPPSFEITGMVQHTRMILTYQGKLTEHLLPPVTEYEVSEAMGSWSYVWVSAHGLCGCFFAQASLHWKASGRFMDYDGLALDAEVLVVTLAVAALAIEGAGAVAGAIAEAIPAILKQVLPQTTYAY